MYAVMPQRAAQMQQQQKDTWQQYLVSFFVLLYIIYIIFWGLLATGIFEQAIDVDWLIQLKAT